MEIIHRTFRAEVKGVDAEEGTVDMFIPVSTNSVDRDGEVIEPAAFKKTLPRFMKRPVLLSSHDYRDLTSQIGEWTKLKITESGMEGKPKWYVNDGNEQADWGFKLAARGMAAFSIGFIPKAWEDGDGVKSPRRTYKEVELLEVSQVIVPSNREAIQSIRSKGVDSVTDKLFEDVLTEMPDSTTINNDTISINIDSQTSTITKPEVTEEYVRVPVDSGNHEGHRIRTIDISTQDGIKALYCGTDKVVMTYLFATEKGWTMEKARTWIKEHEKKTVETAHDVSQEEIGDEVDYLITLIKQYGIADQLKESLDELIAEYNKRFAGNDIPVEIKAESPSFQDVLDAIKRLAKS